MPVWAQPGLGPFLRGGYADWPGQNEWTIAPWVLPVFARRGRLQRRARAHIRRTYRSPAGIVRAEALARVRYTTGDWARCTLAAPRGIVVAHPFRDPRVLAFGLGARGRVRPVPGQQKVVLAEAMRDVLPEAILRRRSKVHYNSVYFTGLSRNVPRLEAMVRDSTVDALGLFDKDCLVRCLKQAALGVRAMNGVIGLNNSLAIVKWLSLLPRWLDQPAEPVRVIGGPERPRRGEAG
jgi:asparagine synthase (glutamine-hydrolysing)